MSMIKAVGVLAGLLAGLLMIAGPLAAAPCVGLVPAGVNPFWARVEAGARQAGRDSGVEVYVRGTRREGQGEAQALIVEHIVEQGCRALVIAPAGPQVAAKVKQLRDQGILSYYIDRDIDGDVQGFIGTDNFRAGQLAAEHLARLLGGRGRIAIVRMSPPVASTSERLEGFLTAGRALGLSIALDRPQGDRSEAVFAALREQLPQIDAVFASNGPTTRMTYAALARMESTSPPLLIGFDSSQVMLEALKAGEIAALVVQQPYVMGYQAVRMAVSGLRGGPLAGQRQRVALDARVVTRENLQQPDIQALLATPDPH